MEKYTPRFFIKDGKSLADASLKASEPFYSIKQLAQMVDARKI